MRVLAACAGAGLWCLAFPALGANEVGRAAAVVPQASGTPPSQAARVLQIGLDMVQNERVQTGPEGRAQLLFLDGTALTVGPNSDLTLDEYVFDPAAGSGRIALSATRGVFRIVGGKISKNEPISLRTPTVTIGVRGGVAFANVGETVSAGFVFGDEMTATAGGRTERTTRPGTEIVTPPGGVPNPPQPLSGATISSSLTATEGAPGQSAGPAVGDQDVAETQISTLSSANAPDALGAGNLAPPPTDAAAAEQAADQTTASQQASTQDAMNSAGSMSPEDSTDALPTGVLVGRYKTSSLPGVDRGTGDDSPSLNIPFTGGAIVNGQFGVALGVPILTFPVNPDSSGLFSFGPSNTTDSPFGQITGAGWLSAAGDYGFVEFTEDDFAGFRGIAFFGTPAPAAAFTTGVMTYALRNDFVLGGSHIPFIPNSLNGDLGPGGLAYFNYSASGSDIPFLGGAVVISGQGTSQRWAASLLIGEVLGQPSSPFIRGEMRGSTRRMATSSLSVFFDGPLASSDAGGGSDFLGNQADFVLEALLVDGADLPVDPLNELGVDVIENGVDQNTIFPNAISLRLPISTPSARTTRTLFLETAGIAQTAPTVMNVRFGTNEMSPGTITLDGGGSASVSAAVSLLGIDGGIPSSATLLFGEPGGAEQISAFVNDKLWGATESASPSNFIIAGNPASFEGAIVSSGLVTMLNVLPAGVTLCTCQFVDWGFWGGQVFGAGGTRVEFPIVPFAAGAPVVAGQFPGVGSASYTGHAIANFYDGSGNFIAGAGMTLGASFLSGTANLTMNIVNLNGNNLTYTGAAAVPGPVGITLSSATGPANFLTGGGSIRFAGPGTPPENVYGHFVAEDMIQINRAAGVIMGQRP